MVKRYDLTEDCVSGAVDITPVLDSHEGRYVSYEDYAALESKYQMIVGHFIKAKQYQNSCKPELMNSAIWQAYQWWKK